MNKMPNSGKDDGPTRSFRDLVVRRQKADPEFAAALKKEVDAWATGRKASAEPAAKK